MQCTQCGLAWDMNDPEPPACRIDTLDKQLTASGHLTVEESMDRFESVSIDVTNIDGPATIEGLVAKDAVPFGVVHAKPPEEVKKNIPYWPWCETCEQPYAFDDDAPFAHCKCGTTEWGDPRPFKWVEKPTMLAHPNLHQQGVRALVFQSRRDIPSEPTAENCPTATYDDPACEAAFVQGAKWAHTRWLRNGGMLR